MRCLGREERAEYILWLFLGGAAPEAGVCRVGEAPRPQVRFMGMVNRQTCLAGQGTGWKALQYQAGQALQEDNREPWKVLEWAWSMMEEVLKKLYPAMCSLWVDRITEAGIWSCCYRQIV